MTAPHRVEIAIVGAGFSGLGMAARLLHAGRTDLVLFERGPEVGGTWRDNTYPGAACDVPSHLYSFSFAPNPDWTHSFSRQEEIQDYLGACADRFDVRRRIRFDTTVDGTAWDDDQGRWEVTFRTGDGGRGRVSARFLVAATGPLAEPAYPTIAGLDGFAGPVWHSARWAHHVDLAGRTVAVVGTGASAVQFVPEIRRTAAQVHVFQRTAPWVLPRRDRPLSDAEHRVFRRLPAAQATYRAGIFWWRELGYLGFRGGSRLNRSVARTARRHLEAQIADPGLRDQLTPDYEIGCKRILLSDDYYPALTQPNVELVTDRITEVTPTSVVTHDGRARPVDAIVLGTGFAATRPPAAQLVRGRGGRRLADEWRDGMAAYKGTAVAGFPNLFYLVGPNTGLGHNSMIYMIESQLAYVLGALDALRSRGCAVLEVRPDAQRRWNDHVQAGLATTVWSTGGCRSWYQDANGRNTTLWPGFSWQFRRSTRHFDAAAYTLSRAPEARLLR